MADGEIHHISESLGEIRATLVGVKETLAEVRKEQGFAGIVRAEMVNQLQTIPGLSGRLEKVEKTVGAHEQLRQRGIGVLAVVALAFGALGHLILNLVDWFLGKH